MCSYTIEELRNAVIQSKNFNGVLAKLGLSVSGSSHGYIKSKIMKLGIDLSHFERHRGNTDFTKKHWSSFLVLNTNLSYRLDPKTLRRCLIEYGKKYECEKCKIVDIWQNDKIVLEIDHINGNWKDNTPDNLRFLCPNCHSQTSNFYHKKRVKKKKIASVAVRPGKLKNIDIEKLKLDLWLKPTIKIAEEFGVSDKAIEKVAKKNNLTKPPRGYWSLTKSNQ